MEHVPVINENEFQAPGAGWHGNRASETFSPPGVPSTTALQNHSHSNFQKSAEKNLDPVSSSTQEGVLVKQGEYQPEYGPLMYAWFCEKQKHHVAYDTFTWKDGSVSEKKRVIPNPPPHFSEWARTIGVTWNRLKQWKKTNPEFAEYYDACEDIIQEFIVDNGLTGQYSGQFGIFAAKNLTKMKDVVVNKNENWNMKDVLDAIEKGKDPNDIQTI